MHGIQGVGVTSGGSHSTVVGASQRLSVPTASLTKLTEAVKVSEHVGTSREKTGPILIDGLSVWAEGALLQLPAHPRQM